MVNEKESAVVSVEPDVFWGSHGVGIDLGIKACLWTFVGMLQVVFLRSY